MSNTRYYKYYQPNHLDHKDKVGDCQIRALSIVLDRTWLEVFDRITPICREFMMPEIFSCDLEKTKQAMSLLGFKYTGISNKKGSKRPTVEEFARSHKQGRYILTVAGHVVGCVDGVYYDTSNCGQCSMYGYYTLESDII